MSKARDISKIISDANLGGTLDVTGTSTLSGLVYPTADGTANQVLKTNGSGTLSFADASGGSTTLSGLTDVTVDSGDPQFDSNPSSGLGHLWLNTTSGEAYVLTTATTDDNYWTNIGDGAGGITGSFIATGGTDTTYTDSTDGLNYKSHTFTSSGDFVIIEQCYSRQ